MSDTDPYRVDVLLTDAGDLTVSARGALVASSGPLNVAQGLILWLRCRVGELPLHQEFGCRLIEMLVGAKTDVAIAASQARTALHDKLLIDPRLTAVRDITARPINENATAIAATFELISGERLLASELGGEIAVDDLQVLPGTVTDLTSEISDVDALAGLALAVDELADELPPFEGEAPLSQPGADADTD